MSVYTVTFRPAAARELRKLPDDTRRRLTRTINALAADPRPEGVKKLSGSPDLYRIRPGEYRVIYLIRDSVLRIVVVRVAHRREVYG